MTKILLSSLAAIALLTGCGHHHASKEGAKTHHRQGTYTIPFAVQGKPDYKVNLSSSDMFETAVLDVNGKKYNVKNAPSGSGVRMAGEGGVEIMFAKGEGVLNLGGGTNDIPLTYSASHF